MNIMDEIVKFLYMVYERIGCDVIIGGGAFTLLCVWVYKMSERNQYSDEAWKVVTRSGKKYVFWYDENGNKVYKRPRISNPPKRRR